MVNFVQANIIMKNVLVKCGRHRGLQIKYWKD